MAKISVVVNTLDEERNLPRALASVKNLADEIIVVDMHSTDKTVEIARKAKAKVFKHRKTGYVEPARNFAIGKASNEWILLIDADEELPSQLANKLRQIAKKPEADYYRLPRKNIIFGKWIKHSRWWPDYNIRFFKKGSVFWSEIIHSVPITHGKGFDMSADDETALVHHHYQTIEQYLSRINRYTTEHAKLVIKDGYQFAWQDLIKKPVFEFLSRYFQGEGYKDGLHGLALAGLQAFSEFSLYLKIWELSKFKIEEVGLNQIIDQMKDVESDIYYWQADSLLKEVGGLKQRIKRKFKLR